VGKTTTAINLAASLAALEKKVLIVDGDPQANATSGIGIDTRQIRCTIYDCLIDGKDPREALLKCEVENLFIIPSNIDLVGAEIEMLDRHEREKTLKEVLKKIESDYDYILIDCSPSLGLLTVNALTASHSVIIPVQCEYFALEGLGKLLNTIKIIQNNLNPELEIEGFLLTMYDSRLRLSNQVSDEVNKHFQQMVFKTIIHGYLRTRLGRATVPKPAWMALPFRVAIRTFTRLKRWFRSTNGKTTTGTVARCP